MQSSLPKLFYDLEINLATVKQFDIYLQKRKIFLIVVGLLLALVTSIFLLYNPQLLSAEIAIKNTKGNEDGLQIWASIGDVISTIITFITIVGLILLAVFKDKIAIYKPFEHNRNNMILLGSLFLMIAIFTSYIAFEKDYKTLLASTAIYSSAGLLLLLHVAFEPSKVEVDNAFKKYFDNNIHLIDPTCNCSNPEKLIQSSHNLLEAIHTLPNETVKNTIFDKMLLNLTKATNNLGDDFSLENEYFRDVIKNNLIPSASSFHFEPIILKIHFYPIRIRKNKWVLKSVLISDVTLHCRVDREIKIISEWFFRDKAVPRGQSLYKLSDDVNDSFFYTQKKEPKKRKIENIEPITVGKEVSESNLPPEIVYKYELIDKIKAGQYLKGEIKETFYIPIDDWFHWSISPDESYFAREATLEATFHPESANLDHDFNPKILTLGPRGPKQKHEDKNYCDATADWLFRGHGFVIKWTAPKDKT